VVLEGEAEVVRSDGNDEVVLVTFRPGTFVGELTLLTGQRRFLTGRVSRAGRVLVIEQEEFRRLMSLRPALAERCMPSAYSVPMASDVLPEPDTPTTATVRHSGTSTSMSWRLLWRAPRTAMAWGSVPGTPTSPAAAPSKIWPLCQWSYTTGHGAPTREPAELRLLRFASLSLNFGRHAFVFFS
jgi:hypothetical protein